jgi:hypothetical protein
LMWLVHLEIMKINHMQKVSCLQIKWQAKCVGLISKLNREQHDYVMHIVAQFHGNDEPVFHFITCGAGVGNSVLIKNSQTVLWIFYSHPSVDPDMYSILLCAPIGKAAFNTKGQTQTVSWLTCWSKRKIKQRFLIRHLNYPQNEHLHNYLLCQLKERNILIYW